MTTVRNFKVKYVSENFAFEWMIELYNSSFVVPANHIIHNKTFYVQ
jgi:hypothetical protein